jgi:hypothetical protein
MKFYESNGNLYTSNAPIDNEKFVEITQEEYELKLSKIEVKQDNTPTEDYWGDDDNIATEQDYQNALAEMGVELNG